MTTTKDYAAEAEQFLTEHDWASPLDHDHNVHALAVLLSRAASRAAERVRYEWMTSLHLNDDHPDNGAQAAECIKRDHAREIRAAASRAASDERERCAKVCESRAKSLLHDSKMPNEANEAGKCASAIRAEPRRG